MPSPHLASGPSVIERGRHTHRQREQGEAGGQRQGPQANGRLARRTKATADGEADDRRPGVLRSAARLGHLVRIRWAKKLIQAGERASMPVGILHG